MKNKEDKIILGIIIFLFLGLLIYIYNSDPKKGPILPCPINKLTGLHCPGCGMTRAFRSLMHFQFIEALKYNALSILSVFGLVIYLIAGKYSIDQEGLLIFYLIIIIGYGILRNFSYFNYL